MMKRIQTDELKPGMYIVDVAGTWSQKLHTERKLFIEDEQFIGLLKQNGFNSVFVDLAKVREAKQAAAVVESLGTEADIKAEIKESIAIQSEAHKTVTKIFANFQKGQKLEVSQAEEVVGVVTESILQNKFVLAGLSNMKQKSRYLYEHALSSSVLMVTFAHTLGFDKDKQRELGLGAMFYDLGMLNVPSRIVNLPGKLSGKQYDVVKRHVEYGYAILQNHPQISEDILSMIIEHHERLDGSGYPFGLKDEEISQVGRMAAIVDVYDASTSDRGYHTGLLPAIALSKLYQNKGGLFDDEMIGLFVKSIGIYPFGTLVRLFNGLVGIVVRIDPDFLLYPQIRIIIDPPKGGAVTPYNLDLRNFRDNPDYKIKEVVPKENLRIRNEEILKFMGVA